MNWPVPAARRNRSPRADAGPRRPRPVWLIAAGISYDGFGSLAFAPLGLLAAGPLAATVGLGRTLAGCASLIVLATLGALPAPGVRGLRATR
ncbi:hypothetical protein [Streptomyces sp. R08]|uniref:MFS transporter n=1 Tax=Streptomyces sp. R08 TaxID=3238624 RepID=A0AB39MCP6_9ACTN